MKILAIGNSFSDDSMEYLYDILSALGEKEIVLGNLYIPGCSMERHLKNAQTTAPEYEFRTNTDGEWSTQTEYTSLDALRLTCWDVVTVQQVSNDSGQPETFSVLPKLLEFVDSVSAVKPKILWNMTWAYQKDSTHAHFYKYDHDQKKMYGAIVDTVKKCVLTSDRIQAVIPVGTAIQNARSSSFGDTFTRDGFHLSIPFGRYIAGLTWARTLLEKSVEKIAYAPDGVDEKMRLVAVESVENAIKNPYKVTQSKL